MNTRISIVEILRSTIPGWIPLLALLVHAPVAAQEALAPEAPDADTPRFEALHPGAGHSPFLLEDTQIQASGLDRVATAPSPWTLQVRPRGSVPLMAAGGALLLAGAVIGGDAGTLIMVGGAGVFAWGVYLHF